MILPEKTTQGPQALHVLEGQEGQPIVSKAFEAHDSPAVMSKAHEGNTRVCTNTSLVLAVF